MSTFSKEEKSYIYTPPIKHNWSEPQKNIFKNMARESGNLIVEARAGAAKTTTILEGFRYIPKGKRVVVLAFNKIIAAELKSRAPSYISDIFTFHSFGFRAIKQRFGNVELDDNKMFDIVKKQVDDDHNYDLINNICDTVAFCKYGLQDTPNQIDTIIDNFNIDLCDVDKEQFIRLVIKSLGLGKAQTSKIDFNDMCHFPFVYNLPLGQYDVCVSDEAQDLNKNQLIMVKKACKSDGRIIMVLDSYQSIYSWRLSDTTVLEELRSQPTTKTLPLPISYRCPKSVIRLAQNWAPDITCPETAIEGEIKDINLNELYQMARPGCFILSRTNAPLIKICMTLIRNSIKANIRGRDVGKQLNYLIKKSKKKQVPAFLKWLESWKNDEVEKLTAKGIKTDNVLDRVECLTNLCDECKTLEEVSSKIKEMFNDSDEKNIVMCSTVHRAKGLQANDVFMLRWTYRVWFDQMKFIEKTNEDGNITYVGATRTVKRLFIVHKNAV